MLGNLHMFIPSAQTPEGMHPDTLISWDQQPAWTRQQDEYTRRMFMLCTGFFDPYHSCQCHANILILPQQFHLAGAKYPVWWFSGFPSVWQLTPLHKQMTLLLNANKSLPAGDPIGHHPCPKVNSSVHPCQFNRGVNQLNVHRCVPNKNNNIAITTLFRPISVVLSGKWF